jgi:hypothetical protein
MNYTLILCFIILLCLINVTWVENFENSTSHSVDLPLNTTFSCKNKCESQSKCLITGEQCASDVDCYGCQPHVKKPPKKTDDVRGQNDAGRLVINNNPQYSTLTTDIGTQAALYSKIIAPAPILNYGVNTWRKSFDYGQQLYDQTVKINSSIYPSRQTDTGLFTTIGPLPSNAYL